MTSKNKTIQRRVLLLLLAAGVFLTGCAATRQSETRPFTIIVLPDTQNYADARKNAQGGRAIPDYSRFFYGQTQWIKDKKDELNIVMVAHVGDIVQTDHEEEWTIADKVFQRLDGTVPYILALGNHDMTIGQDRSRSTRINDYFPPSRFEKEPWYGGHFPEGNDNSYCLFEAGGMKFLVIALEFKPRDETLAWANRVVAQHPQRRCIIVTHGYLSGGRRIPNLGYDTPGNSAEAMWEKLISQHKNIFMVLSGHLDECHLASTGKNGNVVYQIQTNYQTWPKGGSGFLRIMTFVPEEGRIDLQVYSPVLDQYVTKPSSRFSITYPMRGKVKTAAAGE